MKLDKLKSALRGLVRKTIETRFISSIGAHGGLSRSTIPRS